MDMSNILIVGAIEQACEEISLSTFETNVDVHGNGFEAFSYSAGGEIVRYSGTSMAAPDVTCITGKLSAVKPGLTVAQLVRFVDDVVDWSPGGCISLINPRRSFELLRDRHFIALSAGKSGVLSSRHQVCLLSVRLARFESTS